MECISKPSSLALVPALLLVTCTQDISHFTGFLTEPVGALEFTDTVIYSHARARVAGREIQNKGAQLTISSYILLTQPTCHGPFLVSTRSLMRLDTNVQEAQ